MPEPSNTVPTPAWFDLARLLAAHPETWAPGVLRLRAGNPAEVTRAGYRFDECADWLTPEGRVYLSAREWDDLGSAVCARFGRDGQCVPDLADDATAGCLLAWLRAECRARGLTLEIEDDPRMGRPEVRVTGPRNGASPGPGSAWTGLPFGEAVGRALVAVLIPVPA